MNETTNAGAGVNVLPPPRLAAVPDLHELSTPLEDTREVPSITNLPAVPANVVALVPEGVPAAPPEVIAGDPVSELREEFRLAVADIEWRLAQVYEQKLRTLNGGQPVDMVTVEDMNDTVHRLTGYTLTQNTPVGGGTWASLHIVLKGIDFTIANGTLTSAQKYAWFIRSSAVVTGATGTATLVVGNSLPVLGPEDALIFVNQGGVVTSALEASIPPAVGLGAVTQQMLASDVTGLLTQLQADLLLAQDSADGAVTTYFQNAAPWPAGAPAPSGSANNEVGDVWYDSDDGGAFRWSGTAGTPTANTWVKIADTDTSAIAAKLNTKVTTYVATNAVPPVAPAGGFTTGDMWMVTDQGNRFKRWTGAAWADITLGDAALATGISAAKISGELATANIPVIDLTAKTSGNIPVGRVPAGVNGAVLTTATGTVGTTQIANNAVGTAQIANGAVGATQVANGAIQPAKVNFPNHLVY